MPVPANRAKIQLARGNYSNLLASVSEFAEGELSYAKDENLLYIKEEGELIRLEYVTRADLDAAVEESIDLEVYGGDGLLTENGTVGTSPTTTLSIDEVWLRGKTGLTDTREPSGFVDKTETVIAYRPDEDQFWLYPTGASTAVWCQGIKHTFTNYKSIAQPTSGGLYYVYLDSVFGLQIKTTPFNYKTETPVFQIYWDQSTGLPSLLLDRRHGIAMNWATQEFLETANQSVVQSGFGISSIPSNPDGSDVSQAKFALSGGTALFQDVKIQVTHSLTPAPNVASNLFQQVLSTVAKLPVFYRDGTKWSYKPVDDYAFVTESDVPVFNTYTTIWDNAPVIDNNYFISYIIATQNTEYPIISICGQSQYAEISAAEAASFEDLELGDFEQIQFRPLYKIIYKYDNAFTSSIKTVIAGYQDLRFLGAGQGAAVTDHGRLGGLGDDDHTQYVHINNDRTISASHTHSGTITITNETVSSSSNTGALKVSGGVGIAGNLNVDGDVGAILNGGNF
ncbi:MAG: hypothetical protein ACO24P_02095 [Candidatus Nanopelagicaceae bacterium]